MDVKKYQDLIVCNPLKKKAVVLVNVGDLPMFAEKEIVLKKMVTHKKFIWGSGYGTYF